MNIRIAGSGDLALLAEYDRHVAADELKRIVSLKRVYIAEENKQFIGWLRYNLFWDNTPFMNMLYILDGYREKGYGSRIVAHWEEQMRLLGYKYAMTSTASDEYAQHFYVKSGYRAVGGFTFAGDPYELIFMKEL